MGGSIAQIRRQNSWELPQAGVTAALSDAGFADAVRMAGVVPQPTSRFNTRIDYIWFRPSNEAAAAVRCVSCKTFAAVLPSDAGDEFEDSKQLSDHSLVVA